MAQQDNRYADQQCGGRGSVHVATFRNIGDPPSSPPVSARGRKCLRIGARRSLGAGIGSRACEASLPPGRSWSPGISGCGGSGEVGASPEQQADAVCEAKSLKEVLDTEQASAASGPIVRLRRVYERCMIDQGYPTNTSD